MNQKLYIFITNKVANIELDHLFKDENSIHHLIFDIENSEIVNNSIPDKRLFAKLDDFNFDMNRCKVQEIFGENVTNNDELCDELYNLNDDNLKRKIKNIIVRDLGEIKPEKLHKIYQLKDQKNIFAYYIKNNRIVEKGAFDALLLDCISIYNKTQEKKVKANDFQEIHVFAHDKDIYSTDTSDKVLNNDEVVATLGKNNSIIKRLITTKKITFYVFMHEPYLPVNQFLNKPRFNGSELESLSNQLKSIPVLNRIEKTLFNAIIKFGNNISVDLKNEFINLINELPNKYHSSIDVNSCISFKELKAQLDSFYAKENIKLQ